MVNRWCVVLASILLLSCLNTFNKSSSTAIDTNVTQLTVILSEFIKRKNWKHVLLINNHVDSTSLFKKFLKYDIRVTILPNCKGSFNQSYSEYFAKSSEHYVIIWCSSSFLPFITKNSNSFYKIFHWLFVYETHKAFNDDIEILFTKIRVDSNVYVIIPSQLITHEWTVLNLPFKTPDDTINPIKTIARVNSSQGLEWIINENNQLPLRQINISITFFNQAGVVFVKEVGGRLHVRGERHDLFLVLGQYLGFRITYLTPFLADSNSNPFAGMQAQVIKGHANATGNLLTFDFKNLRILDYTPLVFKSGHIVAFKKFDEHKAFDYLASYSHAFTDRVWGLITIFILTCVSFSFFISSYSSTFRLNRQPIAYNIYTKINSFVQDFLTIYPAQGIHRLHSPPTSKKIVVVVLFCFILCVVSSFNSVLMASLAANKQKGPFETLQDMIDDNKFKIGSFTTSPAENIMKTATAGIFQQISQKNMYKTAISTTQAVEFMTNEKFAFMCPILICAKLNCSYELLKEVHLRYGLSIYFTKNSPYTEIFSRYVLRVMTSGVTKKIFSTSSNLERTGCDIRQLATVTLNQAGLPFIILIFGLIASLVVFLLEFIVVYQQTK